MNRDPRCELMDFREPPKIPDEVFSFATWLRRYAEKMSGADPLVVQRAGDRTGKGVEMAEARLRG